MRLPFKYVSLFSGPSPKNFYNWWSPFSQATSQPVSQSVTNKYYVVFHMLHVVLLKLLFATQLYESLNHDKKVFTPFFSLNILFRLLFATSLDIFFLSFVSWSSCLIFLSTCSFSVFFSWFFLYIIFNVIHCFKFFYCGGSLADIYALAI